MIVELLYPLVFAESGVMLALCFQSPLRTLLIKGLDLTKRGRGPVVVQTLSATLMVVFVSSLHGLSSVRGRLSEANPTDQVLMAYHLLEASLLGMALFLGVVVDRMHSYLREIQRMRNKMEDYQQQLQHQRLNLHEGSIEKSHADQPSASTTAPPGHLKHAP